MGSHDLPVIDIGALRGTAAPDARRRIAAELRHACTTSGFFYIANHGVAATAVARLLEETKRFFDEPAAAKERVGIKNTPIFRGYDGVGTETLNPATGGDNKESMYLGVDLEPAHPLVLAGTPHHGLNQWPDWLPGWRQSVTDYFGAMDGLARLILNGLALSLGLRWGHFDIGMKAPEAMVSLRLLHYPPHPDADPQRTVGCGAHTDWGVLTILAQDEVGGLEIQLPSGGWIAASPVRDAFIVNIGDMMARWTNDLYRSTPHRVLNRSPHDRYSAAFFVDTSYHTLVECLPTCCGPDNPPRYPPILAGDHLIKMKHKSYGYTG
jgi:isopenicillin N synthase-like dioxygenase